MTNDQRNPKSECQRQRAAGALLGFRASDFFRISSLSIASSGRLLQSYGNGDGSVDQKEWDGALQLMRTMNSFVAVDLDGRQSKERWRTTRMLTDAASPLLYRGLLYLVKNGGLLTTVDP